MDLERLFIYRPASEVHRFRFHSESEVHHPRFHVLMFRLRRLCGLFHMWERTWAFTASHQQITERERSTRGASAL